MNRYDVRVSEFLLAIIDKYADEWQLPRTKTIQRIIIEYDEKKKTTHNTSG